MIQLLTLGVIGKSLKDNEGRVPIHPEHLTLIPEYLRKQITFEQGYGNKFGVDDNALANLTSGKVATREEILNNFDCILMPKPLAKDLSEIRENAIVWGWPHCVQQKEITQVAIDRKLTLIAWEEMFTWNSSGEKNMHIFYKNNELAGYAAINHSLSLNGISGFYGKPLTSVVISFGSVSRGAIYGLQNHGIKNITVLTNRSPNEIKDQIPGILYKQMKEEDFGNLMIVESDGSHSSFIQTLANTDIIVNGILQDSDNPKMFVSDSNANKLKKGSLIIDISCDEGMGFWCAKPTSFSKPMLSENGINYYAVDHTPTYYWNSASWEISKALLPFLPEVLKGPNSWKENITISKAIEIQDGVIKNQKILSFQNRDEEYPHNFLKE